MENDLELLKYALEHDMIDADEFKAKIEMKKRQDYLKKHTYSIWQANDGTWRTWLPDIKKGRVLKKRKTKKELEDVIIQFYQEDQLPPTINEVFYLWIENRKEVGAISKATYDRYIRQYEQCFKKFGKQYIIDITEYDLEMFIMSTIKNCELTAKGLSNLKILLNGIWKTARKKKIIDCSITNMMEGIDIPTKMLRKTKKDDEGQVFMESEIPKIEQYLMEHLDILNLGLLLLFKSGLRIGELSALRKTSVQEKHILHITSTEICYFAEKKSNSKTKVIYEVRDFPKTDAGVRDVIIPTRYAWIFDEIARKNPFGEYLFCDDLGKRIRSYRFRDRLEVICRKINITPRSPHKIRKTYGTILIDSGIPDSLVIKQMGHTDICTTKNYYYKNRKNLAQQEMEINRIANL